MSGIYGEFSKEMIEIKTYNENIKNFNNYKFDRIHHLSNKEVRFSCFHQHITKESINEELPFLDEESNCIITADLIFDNREDLMEMLEIKDNQITDSQIALKMYLKYGEEFCRYIIGDFAIAIYDSINEKLVLARDQLGKRSLYYRKTREGFAFSTLAKSLIREKENINESYLRKMLSVKMVLNNYQTKETIFNDIFYVLPAHIVVYQNDRILEKQYWKLEKYKKIRDYKTGHKEFRRIFSEAVKCRLRSSEEVGILLSGGFDSTSVASVAATLTNKSIHTFTSIPIKSFQDKTDNYLIFNEKSLVESVLSKYRNLKGHFYEFPNVNAFEATDYITSVIEQPWKSVSNGYWIDGILKDARDKGCRVILDGQSGNYTISYGDIHKYLLSKLLKFNLIGFYKDMSNHCFSNRISRKSFLKYFVKENIKSKKQDPRRLLNSYHKLNEDELKKFDKVFLDMIETYSHKKSTRTRMQEILNPIYLNHLGEAETKIGLSNGLVRRDPTRDIRVIEFCYNCTIDIFNASGSNRSLVTKALKDLVPEAVTMTRKKGYQSIDFVHKLKPHWDSVISELKKCIDQESSIAQYVNRDKLADQINKYITLPEEFNVKTRSEVMNLLTVYSGSVFLKQIKEEYNH